MDGKSAWPLRWAAGNTGSPSVTQIDSLSARNVNSKAPRTTQPPAQCVPDTRKRVIFLGAYDSNSCFDFDSRRESTL